MSAALKELFLLDPGVTYLNHGAYGATPRPVFDRHIQWQYELEREPVDFLSRKGTERLAHSRAVLADYVDTDRDNLVYVGNGTTGINIIARSMKLAPGDEVLTTDHEHGGIDRLWRFMAQKLGFTYTRHGVRLPVTTHDEFVDAFWADVTDKTRVILISHLTSPTALVFPVAEICARARRAGIITVVDGSHVPAQLPLSLRSLDPDFYVGILHKWLCAPKGCAFLYARPSAQPLLDPLVVSWGWEPKNPGPSKFVEYHEWQGSRDISQFLSVPAAIAFQREHDWDEVRVRCKALAAHAQREISALSRLPPYHPDLPEWYGQIVCARLPAGTDDVALLHRLRYEYDIDVSVDRFNNLPRIRVSIQGYNELKDVERLLDVLGKILRE
ncbi:MAG: cys/Met metabolism PLP-dependent enzyme family protein [Betaproteobacteria bacterium]|nr:cys/Met metabolism PLP-dependent enzyme family protein [Betaproteobacteria bacterium]